MYITVCKILDYIYNFSASSVLMVYSWTPDERLSAMLESCSTPGFLVIGTVRRWMRRHLLWCTSFIDARLCYMLWRTYEHLRCRTVVWTVFNSIAELELVVAVTNYRYFLDNAGLKDSEPTADMLTLEGNYMDSWLEQKVRNRFNKRRHIEFSYATHRIHKKSFEMGAKKSKGSEC